MSMSDSSGGGHQMESSQEPFTQRVTDSIQGFFSHRVVVYIFRRFLTMIPLFIGVSILTFGMVKAIGSPVDAVIPRNVDREAYLDQLNKKYGLDKPLHMQYLIWLKSFVTWDFGFSNLLETANPTPLINELIVLTLQMQYAALFLSVAISIPLGIVAARNHQETTDTAISTIALLGVSMPVFVLGIFLILFVRKFDNLSWIPVKGAYSSEFQDVNVSIFQALFNWGQYGDLWWASTLDTLKHLLLPVITLTFVSLALITRLVRSNMLEVLRQDYILSARANGLPERTIIWKHALRNAIIPVITFIGLSFGYAVGGAPITETVFTYPGLGRKYIEAIAVLDVVIILTVTMIITVTILVFNLIADIMYVVVDPRIRL